MPKQSNSLLIYVQVKQDIVKIEWYHIQQHVQDYSQKLKKDSPKISYFFSWLVVE